MAAEYPSTSGAGGVPGETPTGSGPKGSGARFASVPRPPELSKAGGRRSEGRRSARRRSHSDQRRVVHLAVAGPLADVVGRRFRVTGSPEAIAVSSNCARETGAWSLLSSGACGRYTAAHLTSGFGFARSGRPTTRQACETRGVAWADSLFYYLSFAPFCIIANCGGGQPAARRERARNGINREHCPILQDRDEQTLLAVEIGAKEIFLLGLAPRDT